MTKVSAEIVIDAPAERVWEVLADFGSVYKWAPGVTESHSTSSNNSGADAAGTAKSPVSAASRSSSPSGVRESASATGLIQLA